MLILSTVKFLKVLTNSLLGGLFFCLLLSLLLSDLNINMKISPALIAGWTIHLMPIYGLLFVIIAILAFFIIQFFFGRKLRIRFVSPSFLSLSFSLVLLLFLAAFWANTTHFQSFFDAALRIRLRTQMVAFVILSMSGIATFFGLERAKKKVVVFCAYLTFLILALGFLFAGRRTYTPAPPASAKMPLLGKRTEKRITMIGLEGLSLEFLVPLAKSGKLPNFSWLMENGSSGNLYNFTPNEAAVLNASLNTGKLPAKHRVLSQAKYRLWKMKEEMDVVPRFILFYQLAKLGFLQVIPHQATVEVKDFWQILEGNRISFLKKDRTEGLTDTPPSSRAEKLLGNIFPNPALQDDAYFGLAKQAFFRDAAYEEKASEEKNQLQPQAFYLFLDGLNPVEVHFYRYSFPHQFGNIDQESLEKYGRVIENYYGFYDGLLGKYLTGLKEDELLVVFSPHGIEPLPIWKRFVENLLGDASVSAYHELAPDGAVFFYGRSIARGRNAEGIRVVDIVPTLLYYLGLPVGRDMDGIVRSLLFAREFTADNPIIYISSYEEFEIIRPE
jgi:hypothetical protein